MRHVQTASLLNRVTSRNSRTLSRLLKPHRSVNSKQLFSVPSATNLQISFNAQYRSFCDQRVDPVAPGLDTILIHEEPTPETPIERDTNVESFNIHPFLVKNLQKSGINTLFEVQVTTIDAANAGQDLLVRSKTGSGKTLAFGLPLLQSILKEKYELNADPYRVSQPLAVILAPTRELASQVYDQLSKMSRPNGERSSTGEMMELNGTVIYGGVAYNSQLRDIGSRDKPIDFIVGTPGRLNDILENSNASRGLDLSKVKISVLDEADEMLKTGFKEELYSIFSYMPEASQRQNLMFSATFDSSLKQVAQSYMNEFQMINLVKGDDSRIPLEITMNNVVCQFSSWRKTLASILSNFASENTEDNGIHSRVLVFANSKATCDELSSCEEITAQGINCLSLHGDMSQALREKALQAFRDNKVKCIIATDVAARGLDIPEVDLVIHFGLPAKVESFVHRTGRTGRAGRTGTSIALHGVKDFVGIAELEKATKREFVQISPPDSHNIVKEKLSKLPEKIEGRFHKFNSNGTLGASKGLIACEAAVSDLLQRLNLSQEMDSNQRNLLTVTLSACLGISAKPNSREAFSVINGNTGVKSLLFKPSGDEIRMPTERDLDRSQTRWHGRSADDVKYQIERKISLLLANDNATNSNARGRVSAVAVTKDFTSVVVDVDPNVAVKLLEANGEEFSEMEEIPKLIRSGSGPGRSLRDNNPRNSKFNNRRGGRGGGSRPWESGRNRRTSHNDNRRY